MFSKSLEDDFFRIGELDDLQEGIVRKLDLLLRSGETVTVRGKLRKFERGVYFIGKQINNKKYQKRYSFAPGTRITTFY